MHFRYRLVDTLLFLELDSGKMKNSIKKLKELSLPNNVVI